MLVSIEDIKTMKDKKDIDKYRLEERRIYLEVTGHFPRPVLLDSNNRIIDDYVSYAVAKAVGIKEIDCTYDLEEYGYSPKQKTRVEFNSSYSWELKKMVYAKSSGICGQPLSVNNFNIGHWKSIN